MTDPETYLQAVFEIAVSQQDWERLSLRKISSHILLRAYPAVLLSCFSLYPAVPLSCFSLTLPCPNFFYAHLSCCALIFLHTYPAVLTPHLLCS